MTTTDRQHLRRPTTGPAHGHGVRGPFRRVVVGSLVLGGSAAAGSVLGPFAGAKEHVTTGVVLLSFAAGWGLLAALTTRLTSAPQRWAHVPAAAMALTGLGLLLLAPDDQGITAAGWLWPPALLALVVWCRRRIRVSMPGRTRWLLYPVLVALLLAGTGGVVQTVAEHDLRTEAAPGVRLEVTPGRRLHLDCVGTGSPTVVLNNGLGGSSAAWARVVTAVSSTTRVCAYDRAGQGWSDAADQPQDSEDVVADLRRLLEQAGEHGPFVLAGHSAGGAYAMAYAAQHPDEVAGLVLLDSMTPEQFTALADFPGVHARLRRLYGVAPALCRVGVGQLVRALSAAEPPGEAGKQVLALGASARTWRTTRDEHSVYRRALAQAGELTSLGAEPLVVVSASETLRDTDGWRAAQSSLAALSRNHTARTVRSTHATLIVDEAAARQSAEAILDTVAGVRTGTSLQAAAP